jgi:hypothetical protein
MKHRYLIVGLFFFFLSMWLTVIAQAETDISVTGKSSGMGYEPGVGLSASHLYRSNWWGLKGFGDISSQKKRDANSGYTYSLAGQVRVYPLNYLYIAGGYGISGYESKFDNTTWRKHAWRSHAEVGFDGDIVDAWVRYYPRESQTENRVEAVKIGVSVLFMKHLLGTVEVTQAWYDQDGIRENDQIVLLGLGYRF